MDMKIGEVREYRGKKYKCVKLFSENIKGDESKCGLWNIKCGFAEIILGDCLGRFREDKEEVVFVEVKE